MMVNRGFLYSFTIGILGVLAWAGSSHVLPLFGQKRKLSLTVYIHGNVSTHLSILSLPRVFFDTIKPNSLYRKKIEKKRESDHLPEYQLMAEQGFYEISPHCFDYFEQKQIDEKSQKSAANFIIPAYDFCARSLGSDAHERSYYTFGHLGLLSRKFRKERAHDLYHALCDELTIQKNMYDQVDVDIVTYSHGGNIALYLAEFEQMFKRGLKVKNLFMVSTPLQPETASLAYSPMFSSVFNCYVDGDRVQGSDTFSTQSRSYKQFSDKKLSRILARKDSFEPNQNRVFDLCLLVNGKGDHLGHSSVWFMDNKLQSQHSLKPLPLFVIAPAMVKLASKQLDGAIFDCNVIDTESLFKIELRNPENAAILDSTHNMYDELVPFVDYAKTAWNPTPKKQKQESITYEVA